MSIDQQQQIDSTQVGLFESSLTLKCDPGQKITSIDQNQKNVYVGYSNGNINVYNINVNGFKLQYLKSQQQTKKRFFSRNSIDTLREFNGFLLVISEGYLHCLDGETLDIIITLLEKVCIQIAINEVYSNRILAVTKKKDVLIFDFELSPFGFKQFERKLSLTEIPLYIQFLGEKIVFVNQRKEFGQLDINTNIESKAFSNIPKNQYNPLFKVISQDEIFVLATNNLGIFLTLEGAPKQKNTLQLESSKSVFGIHMIDQFLIAFYEGTQIDIFNTEECQLIQSLNITYSSEDKSVKCITPYQNQNVLYFTSLYEIKNLYPVSYEEQIKNLLTRCEIEQARKILDQYFSKNNPERQNKLKELNVDLSWSLLVHARFDEAYLIIEDSYLYDIRQYFENFQNEVDILNTIASIKQKLRQQAQYKGKSSKAISQMAQDAKGKDLEFRFKLLQFLIKLSLKNREYYLKYINASSKTFDFYISSHAIKLYTLGSRERHGGQSFTTGQVEHQKFMEAQAMSERQSVIEYFPQKIEKPQQNTKKDDENDSDQDDSKQESNGTAKEMLDQIDFNLLKYLIMQDNSEKDIIQFLSNNNQTYCPDKYDELLQLLLQKQKSIYSNEVLSLFYEHFNNHTQALLLWQEMISYSTEMCQIACEHISRILSTVPREKLVTDFLPDVMRFCSAKATKVFAVLNPNKYPPAKVRQLISEVQNLPQKDKDLLIGSYYEQLVSKYDYTDTNIHNSLADYLQRQLFALIPKSTPRDVFKKSLSQALIRQSIVENQKSSQLLQQQQIATSGLILTAESVLRYNTFDSFLMDPKMQYDAQFVLKIISDSFLQDQIVFLLSRLDRHEKALRILIDQGEDEAAMKQCSKDHQKLLPIAFKIYMEKYNQSIGKVKQQSNMMNDSIIFYNSGNNSSLIQIPESNNNNSTIVFSDSSSQNIISSSKLKSRLDIILQTFNQYQDVNPIDLFNYIPDDWLLCSNENQTKSIDILADDNGENSNNTALFDFLTQALSETLYTQRQMRCSSFSSESELLEQKLKLINLKKAYITQYNDRKCASCNKLIIHNTLFVVFPNGVIAHQSCVGRSLSICPETGQDFSQLYLS